MGALVIAALSRHQIGAANRYAVIVPLAVAMGIQNATARRLAVADLTTTVLTQTLTGMGRLPADRARGSAAAHSPWPRCC
jgi:uncharacterized membrane protein YoaK (UPF0700 family)